MNGWEPLDLRRSRGVQATPASPSRRPTPLGRGRFGSGVGRVFTRWGFLPRCIMLSLSRGERERVRGNKAGGLGPPDDTRNYGTARVLRRAGGFPG